MSLVYCASVPTPSGGVVVPASDANAKPYVTPAPPMSIVDVRTHIGVVAAIAATTLEVAVGKIAPPCGGWVVDLETLEVFRVAAGDGLDLRRALVMSSRSAEPDPIPPAWAALPPPPFAPLEDAPRSALPVEHGPLVVAARSEAIAALSLHEATAEVPRYWLARTLFRLALHDLRLGHVETYGGVVFDDHAGGDLDIRVGRHTVGIPRAEAMGLVERLYRAVAPPGYTERLSSAD
jgi:hypothetical protein